MRGLAAAHTSNTKLVSFLFVSFACLGFAPVVHSHDDSGDGADEIDYYAVLGLTPEATDREVRQRFRELSRKYHPDVSSGGDAREMFSRITRANEVLSDKKKRRMYDMRGEEGLRQLKRLEAESGGGQFGSISQLFRHHAARRLRGKNTEATLHLPLDVVYTGGRRTVTINKQKVCTKCRGTGAKRPSGLKTCEHCGGHGILRQRLQLAPGMFQEIRQTCPYCGGRGSIMKERCGVCGGNGVHRADVELTVDIDAGMPEGHVLSFEMEADESPDTIPGDLLLSVQTKKHPRFSRRANDVDLDMTLVVTLKEALLGFQRRVEHLDGSEFFVNETGITQYGAVLKVPGKGMPRHNVPSEFGDLYVKVLFEMPDMLTKEQREELAEHL
ncbi:chaperone protein DNAj, putative [Trypanosoma brucei gambiense DAL972]|uniref:Chaperone protein DNAj, putative n=2 Tax=Trypanosoma brucei TaxID=5691 RepID=D0AAR6_TRYB9|nr:chaperone protein DNAj, putative [Trypanosoma brucei gambiense DAL972]RHW68105.1 chaperone protein DNAj [Trypanosoma brucei equiperdum]CBH18767.1 chaperone protein DNAj, putative [Trypanosoma brucei gambiense DAL972]|eukprot:XP_011781031.1 chaperone protein DNAj, putative [Trypanosoma brucei gambiense DAL972]